MVNTHLNYCFLPYGTVKHDAGGYHIGHILIGLERIYGERQVIQCQTVINNHKIFFVNSLNIFTKCRILRLFPSASRCEITMCRFHGATFAPPPITL